ncbi:MAG: hypothetical protein WB689_01830 [Xanthobacteraceae bacterium]
MTKTAASFLWFTTIQRIERKQDPANLSPKGGFIAAEAIERKIGQVSQSQKAASELDTRSVGFHPGVGHRY